MKGSGVLVIAIGFASVASAQPSAQPAIVPAEPVLEPSEPRRNVGYGGVMQLLTQGDSGWLSGAIGIEGGIGIPTLPLRARVFATLAGGTIQSDWGGEFVRYGAGVEATLCKRVICGFLDLDLGYQRQTLVDDFDREQLRSGPIVGPRVGIEVGTRVRGRFSLERYWFKTHHDPSRWQTTGGVTAALVYAF